MEPLSNCFLFGRPNRVIEIACFDSKLQNARNSTCERKETKRRECLLRERLVQGKKHAEKKALLATFTISKTLLQICKHNSQQRREEEIKSDDNV